MKILRLGVLAQLFYFACLPIDSAAADVVVAYSEPLTQLTFSSRATSAGAQKPSIDRLESMQFDAFGRRFDIRLEENRSLMTPARRQKMAATIAVYRGEIASVAGSWVRLTVEDGAPSGMLWDGQEAFAIDVVAGETAIYRLADLHIEGGTLSCSEADIIGNGNDLLKVVLNEASARSAKVGGPGAISEIDMAIVGDFEFASVKGASAEADIVRRMNNVDGIFSAQLGVQLNVTQVEVFTAGTDPFADESDPGEYLNDFADFRFATPDQHINGLSHLFTGRNLDGSTVGIAFGGGTGSALCSRRFGAGLTQGTHSTTFDSLIAAHELGHNFGAPHDGTTDSACESTEQDFLMAPSLNGSDMFSACSIMQMQADVNSASCISALPIGDIAVVASDATPTVLQGNTATIVFEVNSAGTEDVSDVALSISVPANITVSDVAASSGSCSTGAGNVTCMLGNVAAGSGETVTVTAATPAVGAANFSATASATGDANANNNQASAQLTIDPAIDLAVDVTANTSQIVLNQSVTLQMAVENRASLVASNVNLIVTVDAGLRIDTANWDSGSCEIDGTVVNCMAPDLAGQSIGNLELQATGITAGVQDYTVSISATEADRDTSNNDFGGQINVTATTTSPASSVVETDSGGGGGSVSLLILLGLFWLYVVPQARRHREVLH